ncbi:hypothetical protein CKO42_21880 [Lamprobacter modestohalophilus]|uniref:Uncharacterized protein n=1 Tax=Lamprobacter modestohalophilus TaxID=1064514 RepID=A0A9X0WCK0_9GAMM|nr:hypothetical protein [Lamprobacter modestohalophilus]MBK1621023.1 hypothetical protein [Lamprobacter modestohalophilus]
MIDTEIRQRGVQLLAEHLGDMEMERFIALIQREPFDYTRWRQQWFTECEESSIEDISRQAMALKESVS